MGDRRASVVRAPARIAARRRRARGPGRGAAARPSASSGQRRGPRTSRDREAARPHGPASCSLVAAAFLTATGLVMVLSAGSVSAAQGYDGNPLLVLPAAADLRGGRARRRLRSPRCCRTARLAPAAALPLLGGSCVLMLIAAHPAVGDVLLRRVAVDRPRARDVAAVGVREARRSWRSPRRSSRRRRKLDRPRPTSLLPLAPGRRDRRRARDPAARPRHHGDPVRRPSS